MKWNKGVLIAALMGCATPAWGQHCSVEVLPVRFGQYDPLSPLALDALGAITIACTSGVPYRILLGPSHHTGKFVPRMLVSTRRTGTLAYNLYLDAARSQIWGDGTGTTPVRSGMGTGVPQVMDIFGRIPPQQNVPVGHYADKVTVTVLW